MRDARKQILETAHYFYQESHESSYHLYHLILEGIFTGLGYRLRFERETGYGRSDLIILDPARSRRLILEFGHVKEKE